MDEFPDKLRKRERGGNFQSKKNHSPPSSSFASICPTFTSMNNSLPYWQLSLSYKCFSQRNLKINEQIVCEFNYATIQLWAKFKNLGWCQKSVTFSIDWASLPYYWTNPVIFKFSASPRDPGDPSPGGQT